jgi:hypothetical protein
MLGVDLDVPDELSSTPNSAPVIRPDPCGKGGGASLAARAGFGDGALEAVGVPFSFLDTFVAFTGGALVVSESISIATGCWRRVVFSVGFAIC